jgi:hypothetical protein
MAVDKFLRKSRSWLLQEQASRLVFIRAARQRWAIERQATVMRKEIEEVVKDTAAVGLSAAVLGLEMGKFRLLLRPL